MKRVPKTFRLDPDLVRALEEHSRVSGQSMTEVVEKGAIHVLGLEGGQAAPVSTPALIPVEEQDGLKMIDTEALLADKPGVIKPPMAGGWEPKSEERPPMPPETRENLIRERAAQLSEETDLSPPELRRKAELELEEKEMIW